MARWRQGRAGAGMVSTGWELPAGSTVTIELLSLSCC